MYSVGSIGVLVGLQPAISHVAATRDPKACVYKRVRMAYTVTGNNCKVTCIIASMISVCGDADGVVILEVMVVSAVRK